MKKALKLLKLALLWFLAGPCLLCAVLSGIWDWLGEVRQVGWHVRSMWQTIRYSHREICDPGCTFRERLAAMMPTSYQEKPK